MKKVTFAALSMFVGLAAASAAFATDAPTPPPAEDKGQHQPRMLEEADTNHDGSISKEEWVARGDTMFKEIDANADGKITPDEMKAHHEKKRAEWKERQSTEQVTGRPLPTAPSPNMTVAPAASPTPPAKK